MGRHDILTAIAFLLNASSPIVLTVIANYIMVYLNLPPLPIAFLDAIVFVLTSAYFDHTAIQIINSYVELLLTEDTYYQIVLTTGTLLGLMMFAVLYKNTLPIDTLVWFTLIATDIAFLVKWALLYFSRIEVKLVPRQMDYQQKHESTN